MLTCHHRPRHASICSLRGTRAPFSALSAAVIGISSSDDDVYSASHSALP